MFNHKENKEEDNVACLKTSFEKREFLLNTYDTK
jgi:hypothetical protein